MGVAVAHSNLIDQILIGRGYKTALARRAFLSPDYEAAKHDPMLLPDMGKAIARLKQALENDDQITVYGDYDVDGMTATALLLDALPRFGFRVDNYTPDRFREGYGLNKKAVETLAARGTKLILTVDNGIVSLPEVARANELGIDVIVTDHHSPRKDLPDAVAVVDPKIIQFNNPEKYDDNYVLKPEYADSGLYPFLDMCGCGVAFKLVQQLQKEFPDKLPMGQEKWLLDLVALGTVSDVVALKDENRAYVKWGLEVIKKTRRPGIRALAAVAGVPLGAIDSRAIGFMLGPRLNASGRLKHARIAIELLTTHDNERALALAEQLNELNNQRKKLQNEIYEQAAKQVDVTQPIAIAVGDGWHEGVVGIVASKIEEKFERPAFVFSRTPTGVKASGRSFGDFSIAAAITATRDLLIKGGGHVAAGGLTVSPNNFDKWCAAVQDYYRSLHLPDQRHLLYPAPDLTVTDFSGLTVQMVQELNLLEPFGAANEVPVFKLQNVMVTNRRTMGSDSQHVRYTFMDANNVSLDAIAFNAADRFTIMPFDDSGAPQYVDALVELELNEWHGVQSVEGKLIKLDAIER